MALAAQPDTELESALDADGNTVRVGEQVQSPRSAITVTRIYKESTGPEIFAETSSAAFSPVILNLMRRA